MTTATYTVIVVDDIPEEQESQEWTLEQILEEINRDRSEEWTDYDESDWQEGWKEWVEGDGIYTMPLLAPPKVSLLITYGCGSNLEGCYSRVTGASMEKVREEIHRATGGKYSFSYADDAKGAEMIKTWDLKEVELQPMYPREGSY